MSIASKHAYRFEYLKSDKWKTVRLEALVRERGKCQICAAESIYNDAHHIWYPDSIWETTEEHLAILCRSCHDFLHTIMPECKTGNEKDGRKIWKKFRNAIIAWRCDHINLFKTVEGIETISSPVAMRAQMSRLGQRVQELEKILVDRNGNVDVGVDLSKRNGTTR